jgi:hypothetical protein
MKLTKTAQQLEKIVNKNGTNCENRPQPVDELATCMGTESFGYALFDGGYLNPEDWVEGNDLIELKKAITLVGEFKDLVEGLHDNL